MRKVIFTGLKFLIIMTILTGLLYPGFITIITSVFFHREAQGSLVRENGITIGSELIGQNFESQKYFWSRPSVINYNPIPSGASNLGPLNPLLKEQVLQRARAFRQANTIGNEQEVPPEMITASASGLDPHISPAAALLQVKRVAKARGLTTEGEAQIIRIINDMTEKPQFSVFGKPRINVFLLNLKIDNIK
jgi:potassium-transporting ATPase KdpC subunit